MILFPVVISYWLVTNAFGDFLETTEVFSISEEAAVGSQIGRVHLTSGYNYRVSGVNHYFNFDPVTGWISLRRAIDREELSNGAVELLLLSTPPSLIHVLITVLDVNDNSPTFPVPFQNVSVIESSAVGTRIPLLPAVDPDAGDNGTIVEYGIEGDSAQFGLIYEKPGLLYLEVKQALDRESSQLIVLNVTAIDGGIPPRIGYTTIYVDIIDVNDNAPTFSKRELETKWSGRASTPIFTLNATDADRGKNGEIAYSIPGPESEHFLVDGDRIFAKKDTPACCPSPPCTVCFVSIRATDHGTPPLESTALLKILLSNENLHDPLITIRLHPSTVDFALIEAGAIAGKTVAVLTVTDEDGPLSDSSSVWIESGNEDQVFDLSVQRQFSILKLLKNAADIKKSEYNLVFVASDGQVPQRLANTTLKIYNEAKLTSSPVVVEREISISIPEDSPMGSFVAQVHTNSSGCEFNLNGDVPFEVDRRSGIITTSSTMDVNLRENYALEVLVRLPAPSIHTITATVTVTIIDVNNHAPSFVNLPDRLLISEDTTVGSIVFTVKTLDKDRGDNARLLYRLLSGVAIEYLSIDRASGRITLRKAVDFEAVQGFDLEIEVCDYGHPELCTSTILAVVIQDVNDNEPQFPCSMVHSVLPVNSPPGTVVATVFAEDRDSARAGQVHYALLDAITGFVIDGFSGVIQTTEPLQDKKYTIRIGASDGYGVMSTNNVTVTLFTTKKKPLKWTSGPSAINLSESAMVGDALAVYHTNLPSSLEVMSPLLSINSMGSLHLAKPLPIDGDRYYAVLIASSDDVSITKCVALHVTRDSPAPAFLKKSTTLRLKRSFPLGKQLMKVDAGSRCNFSTNCRWLRVDGDGVVAVSELIDKSIDSVQCEVEAKDSKGRSDRMKIQIAMERDETVNFVWNTKSALSLWTDSGQLSFVEQFNLNATYSVYLKENARAGTMLIRLGNDSNYVFKSSLKTPIDVFPDGTVYLRKDIDDSSLDVISLPVTATHRFLNNTYSTMVHVFIEDVNDHSPQCSHKRTFEIEENISVGSTVGYLDAQDDDIGLNGVIGYRLLDNQNLIRIGTVSGKITTATVFDAEKLEKIDFKYEVYDYGSPSKAVVCNATVVITDLNDNAPIFDRHVYTAAINVNNLSENRTVVVVNARDKDRTAKIFYKLLNYLHLFEIDATSGQISRKGRLRPDSRFNISVAAIDEDEQMATAVLIITTSSDDSALPVFDRMEPFRISSSSPPGSIIGKIKAVAGRHVIKYCITDEKFDVDSWGNAILADDSMTSGVHEFVVTASTAFQNATTVQQVIVENGNATVEGRTFRVKENLAPETITEIGEDLDILLTVPSTTAFKISGQKLVLVKPLDYEKSSTYHVLVGNKRTSQLITVEVTDVNDSDLKCDVTTFIVDALPFSVPLHCKDPDSQRMVKLTYRTTSSDVTISEDGRLFVSAVDGMMTSVAVDVVDGENSTNRRSKKFTVRLIRGTTADRGISFPSTEISMLVASSQPIGTALGRITAESTAPLKYYVAAVSSIQIDEDSGVVSLKRRTLKDETAIIVAVSSTGTATVKVNIEVIEDSLALSRDSFLFVPRSLSAGQTLGQIDVGREDVAMELSDPYVYNRGKELLLKKGLELGDQQFYNCSATIRKGRLSSTVMIYILQSAHNASLHEDSRSEYWIRENAPYGSVVGRAPTSTKGPVTYSIVGDIGLSIDHKTGMIKTTTVFDHEERQLYSFKLRLTFESGEFNEREAILVIDDENDNMPKFANDVYTVDVAEDVEIGTEIARLQWSDPDFNNAFHLSTVEGNELGLFEVNNDGRITIASGLDRERLPVHRLVVRLSDGVAPYPYHTTDCVVIVNLRDVNDNAPVFESSAEFLVEENSPRMKIIGKVKAVDADEGQSAVVHYRVIPESLPRAEFIIDAVRGDLMVNKALDFEKTRNYTFTVAAMDYGTPQMQSLQQVTVHVVDVNDHAPVLRSSSPSVEIDEVTPRGTSILQFEIDDGDCLENAASVFAIEEGYGVFDVSPTSGELYVNSPLDFESQSLYNITVSARNIAGGAKSYRSVIVHVKDSNDERPRFVGGSPVQFSVYENLPGPFPAVIGSTISEDLDSGENGLIAYSIFKGNATLFSINTASGEVLVLGPLDREDCAEHFLTVQAIDSGSTRLSSTAEIKITVLDDNDNAPEFDQPYYVIRVRENTVRGQKVLKVTAFDKDEGQNAVVRYSLLEQSPFSIDKATGEIRVTDVVDREQINVYTLTIQATDSGRYRRLTSTAQLTIFVDDENDNNPIIRNKLLDVFVPQDLKTGDVVHVVDAIDFDANSTLSFNISGPDARFFAINARGEIIAKTVLAMKAYYSITVGVFDRDGLNTSASFTFYLDDRNHFPRWLSTMNRTSLHENSSEDVFQFAATSSQAGSYITYSILSGNDGSFDIDPLSGKLSISRGLDRESRPSYRLWIAATDSDSPPKLSIAKIDIVVEDVNDNHPVFDKVIYSVEIMENSDPKQHLCVSATDRDQGNNADISYSIIKGNFLDTFAIDERTGCIRSTRMLDRESIPGYRLVIMAKDHGNPPLSTEAIVEVKVLDEDDNAPKFSHLFHAEIPEDLEVGSPVLIISASDPDGFGNHTFSIDNETITPFSIDAHTGQIYLRRPLDREQMSSYRLRVRVSDGTWAVQTGAAISILDVNDNAPVFEKQRYVFIVNETLVNQTFGKVLAKDADEDENGIVHYRLQRDIRYISIDIVTGEMKLLALPEKGVIMVTITAQDNGVPAMRSSVPVIIVSPSEDYGICDIAINKDTPKGTILGRIEDYCNHGSEKEVIRRFLSDETFLTINSDGDLVVAGDVSKNVEVELISVLKNGEATIHHVRLELSHGNANPPHFEERIFHFTIAEDAERGDMMGAVYAKDTDVGLAGKLRYCIESHDVPFQILSNGTLVVSGRLDYEHQRRYVFNVTAADQGQPPRNATTQVVVDLLDVNDNPPVIEDAELVYAVTNLDEMICPSVTDIDTSQNDLQYFVSTFMGIITTDSCFSIPNDIPPVVDWTVSDGSQSTTARIVLIDMIPKDTNIHDESSTLSENAAAGTIVLSYEKEVFAEKNEQLSVDGKDVKVIGNRRISDDHMTIYAKSKFGRHLKSSKLRITASKTAPAPVFRNAIYALNISDTMPVSTTIHDFGMSVPADCHLAIANGESEKPFCFFKGSMLNLCGHLKRPYYTVVAETVCDNKTRSRSEIVITVVPTSPVDNPIVGFLNENVSSVAIAQLPSNQGQKFTYRIGDKRLREIFTVTPEGILMSLRPLKQSIRDVYDVPVVAQPENGRPSTQHVLVFVEADLENAVVSRHLNATVVFAGTPTELDLSTLASGTRPECASRGSQLFEISPDCHITVKQSVDNVVVEALINGTSTEITLNTLQVSEELEQSALQVVLYAAPGGVANFLTELQRSYSDLTFYPLAVEIVDALHRNTLSLAVVDRNRRVIAVDDSRDILRSFFQKDDFPHALLQSMKTSLCDDVICSNGGRCRQRIALKNSSTSFYGSESIWSVPNGAARTRCECASGYVGEYCEQVNRCDNVICPDGRCSTSGNCTSDCELTCKNGVCFAGMCECLDGFTGIDCSMRVFDGSGRKHKKRPYELKKPSKTRKMSCSDLKCGDGVCQTESGRAICHCVDGFVAVDCSVAEQAISMTSGFITLTPTEQLQNTLKKGISSPAARDFCNGSRSIEIDFRTRKSYGTIVALSYEAEFAAIEVHASVVRYRVFDSYRTLVEITLGGQVVDDGNWHQVVLELSEDRKVITFKVDGIGKQAMSHVVLPSIISADLKRIQLGINGLRGQFTGCLRRFVVNGELQSLRDEEKPFSEFFTKTVSGDVTAGCSFGSAHLALLQKPGVLASLICVTVFAVAAGVMLAVARVIRRRETPNEITWQRTEEIDAYAVHKPLATSFGHINRALTTSSEGPIYASADGYETPIHLRQQHRKMKPAIKPSRTVADIVLAVRPSLSDAERSKGSSICLDTDCGPSPPRGVYRNIAYF